ncbi:unnamed protein product [Fusarium venenatum]|uniref:Uncharacterized protein n=1 Tax=Fusarium venenatum TaxID=56646 RepID=A0A2L2TS26_9HYPO|nr:uncharacterized protein FVRRES_03048 [Fusarium venenatum]CEI66536.1 unnamed protein product [Fusarium venenatum]
MDDYNDIWIIPYSDKDTYPTNHEPQSKTTI